RSRNSPADRRASTSRSRVSRPTAACRTDPSRSGCSPQDPARQGVHEIGALLGPLARSSGLACGRRALRRTCLTATRAAAVFGEIADQAVHRRNIRAIPDEPAVTLILDQAGIHEFLEVKGERRRCEFELEGDGAGRQAIASVLDQQTEDRQAGFLGERSQGRYRAGGISRRSRAESPLFHNSIIVQISNDVNSLRLIGAPPGPRSQPPL